MMTDETLLAQIERGIPLTPKYLRAVHFSAIGAYFFIVGILIFKKGPLILFPGPMKGPKVSQETPKQKKMFRGRYLGNG
jgi:hypothetical protein